MWVEYVRWWQDRAGPVQQLLPVLERCAHAFCEKCSEYCEERDELLCNDCYDEEDWSDEDEFREAGYSDEYDSEGEEGWDDEF